MHVYAITNLVNGKIYVGQHKDNDLDAYLRGKFRAATSVRGRMAKMPLLSAIRKYGNDNFSITSLVRPVDAEQMDEMEKFFIRVLESNHINIGYNVALGGHGLRGVKFSQEHRDKIGNAHRGRPRSDKHRENLRLGRWVNKSQEEILAANKKIGDSHRGKSLTIEHRENIAKSQRGIARTPFHTEETKQKMKRRWSEKKTERLAGYKRGSNGRFY